MGYEDFEMAMAMGFAVALDDILTEEELEELYPEEPED